MIVLIILVARIVILMTRMITQKTLGKVQKSPYRARPPGGRTRTEPGAGTRAVRRLPQGRPRRRELLVPYVRPADGPRGRADKRNRVAEAQAEPAQRLRRGASAPRGSDRGGADGGASARR